MPSYLKRRSYALKSSRRSNKKTCSKSKWWELTVPSVIVSLISSAPRPKTRKAAAIKAYNINDPKPSYWKRWRTRAWMWSLKKQEECRILTFGKSIGVKPSFFRSSKSKRLTPGQRFLRKQGEFLTQYEIWIWAFSSQLWALSRAKCSCQGEIHSSLKDYPWKGGTNGAGAVLL